jgi:hypothetical protein
MGNVQHNFSVMNHTPSLSRVKFSLPVLSNIYAELHLVFIEIRTLRF